MATITKYEQQQQMRRQAVEQEQLVGYWAKTLGISKQDIEHHACIDDIILLKKFRQEFWDLPPFWKHDYDRIYKSVYAGIKLKAKQLKKLKQITEGMIKWRSTRQERVSQSRQKIRTLIKSTDDIAAKAVRHAQTPPWE